MNQSRAQRVSQLMQRELGQMLLAEVKDPRIGFVSITRVEVTRDLSQARVFVSVLGDAGEQSTSLEGLKKAATFLRGEIGRRLGLRRAPEILFRLDQGIEESVHIQHLIRSLDPDGRDE